MSAMSVPACRYPTSFAGTLSIEAFPVDAGAKFCSTPEKIMFRAIPNLGKSPRVRDSTLVTCRKLLRNRRMYEDGPSKAHLGLSKHSYDSDRQTNRGRSEAGESNYQ